MLTDYIKRLKSGDMSSFAPLYEATKKSIYINIFSLVKNESDAEDILQETYLKFLKNISSIDENANPLGYLFTTSRNLSLDFLKAKNRYVPYEDFENIEEYAYKENEELDEELLTRLQKYLNTDEIQIVLLHAVDGFTHKEIAQMKNMPLGSVTWAYNNAIKKLKKGWEDDE